MPTTSALTFETAPEPEFSLFREHQSELRQLYLEQNKSLKEVKKVMETSYGFPETDLKKYESGLRSLGFYKKLAIKKWAIVEAHVKKRKREGKDTDIYLSDVLQPPEKIARALSRNPKAHRVQIHIGKGSTPDWPEGVSLKTPPRSPIIPNLSLEVSAINEARAILDFQQLSLAVRARMISNPDSTVHLLLDVPSSQIRTLFMQTVNIGTVFEDQKSHGTYAFSFPWDSAPSRDMSLISQLHHGPSYTNLYANSNTPDQLQFAEALSKLCIVLANNQELDITDTKEMLFWVGMDINKSVLKAFFAPKQPAVAATWARLIKLSRDLRSSDAFQALVEVGFETNNGEWIEQYVKTLIESTVKFGSKNTRRIAQRLFSSESARFALRNTFYNATLNLMLRTAAERLDVDMVSNLVHAGASFEGRHVYYSRLLYDLKSQRTLAKRQQYVSLLKLAGHNFDFRVGADEVIKKVLMQSSRSWESDKISHDNPTNIHLLDALLLSGQDDIYDDVATSIKTAMSQIMISGLIMAARSGTDQLQLYLNSKQAEQDICRQIPLEMALSIAAGLGDVTAVQAFCEAKVDPNVRWLLSDAWGLKVEWHPLMRALTGKHLNVVRTLIEMGTIMAIGPDSLNPLSVAICNLRPLSDRKRDEQLEIVRYFLGMNLPHRFKAEAMVKATIPPRHNIWDNDDCITWRNFIPDEEIVNMLLDADIRLDGIMEDDKDVLHLAIDRSCNLRTVKFLLSRGAQIHSRPCLRDGKTMLHSACASRGTDSLRIVKLLLQHGADCKKEWGGLTILESTLSRYGEITYNETARRQALQLFSLLYSSKAQLNGPKERLPEVKAKWTPIVILLLRYEAPDTLIYQIIQDGADINSPGQIQGDWYTPLQYAVKVGRLDVAHQLLEKGANINAPPAEYGFTVLQAACSPDDGAEVPLAFIQFLLDNGADVNVSGGGIYKATALHCAIEHGSMGVFCLLLDAGANIHATKTNYRGRLSSTLDVAASTGRLDMTDMLLRKGAESYTQKKTPYDGAIDRAREAGHFAIANMIEKFHENQLNS